MILTIRYGSKVIGDRSVRGRTSHPITHIPSLTMASYLRSWLPTLSVQQSNPEATEEEESPTTPTVPSLTIENSDDEDLPPAFPAIESAQRISSASSTSSASSSQWTSRSSLMPPPPSIPLSRIPGPPAPSAASSLMPPPTTTKPPTQLSKSKKREKVALAPGHSPLDWAALKSSGTDLRVWSLASASGLSICAADHISVSVERNDVPGAHTSISAARTQQAR